MKEQETQEKEYKPVILKYQAISEKDPSTNFIVRGETYEEVLENALMELGFTLFNSWD